MIYYVYIIKSSSNKRFYVGMTMDVERRLKEHNGSHKATKTTFKLHDYELVFCQMVGSRNEARELEKYFKSGAGREIRSEIIL